MLPETPPPPEAQPRPGDLITLQPGTLPDQDAEAQYVVADRPAGRLELNHEAHHPAYWDWAAAVDVTAARGVTRCTPAGAHTWTLDGGGTR